MMKMVVQVEGTGTGASSLGRGAVAQMAVVQIGTRQDVVLVGDKIPVREAGGRRRLVTAMGALSTV
jgi:hypothetical protein